MAWESSIAEPKMYIDDPATVYDQDVLVAVGIEVCDRDTGGPIAGICNERLGLKRAVTISHQDTYAPVPVGTDLVVHSQIGYAVVVKICRHNSDRIQPCLK